MKLRKILVLCAIAALGCDPSGDEGAGPEDGAGGKQDDAGASAEPAAILSRGDVPGLFDVVDVAEDDVLNIRREPTADSPIVGTLGPHDTNVEVIGSDHTGNWGIVNLSNEGGSGWVSMRFLESNGDLWESGQTPITLACHGTEPFWGFHLDGDDLVLNTPDLDDASSLPIVHRLDPAGFLSAPYRTIIADDGQRRVTASVAQGLCSDGASDNTYGLSANITIEDGDDAFMMTGCCRTPAFER